MATVGTSNPGHSFNHRAAMVTATSAYRALSITGYATAATAPIGVSHLAYGVGDYAASYTGGSVIMEASAAIAANALVEVATDGKSVTRTSGVIIGRAITAAAGAGSFHEVLIDRQ